MAVLANNVTDPTIFFDFTCPQWALMSVASKADWTVTENTCGIQTAAGSPFAASDFIITLNGIIAADAPLSISAVDGVYTISIDLPQWYNYKGTIAANRVFVPVLNFVLGSASADCYAIVRRQTYFSPDDFTINTVDNSLDFVAGLGLSGQVVNVRAFL